MKTRLRLTRCILALASLSACTQAPTQNQHFLEQSAQAESLVAAGQHKQAARLYQNLADSRPTQQNRFRLLAAQELVRSGEHESAKQYADSIDPSGLSEQQRQQLNLIYAQINLSRGNAEQARHRLELIRAELLNKEDRKGFYRSEAFAYSLTGDVLASAKARIQLNDLLTDPQEIDENNAAILETLSLLPSQSQSLTPPAPDILSGWVALANLLKQRRTNAAAFPDNLLRWQRNFPHHPANSAFLQSYLEKPGRAFKQPSSIAIILPESGPYAQAAKIIREGFMAAYYQQHDAPQPTIRFYDSQQSHPSTLYDLAVANGAELIIGPLEKDAISALASNSDLNVPVLALNHVDNLVKDNLYQFGLSPIDEAKQLAAKAWQDGRQKILILTPEGEQGTRIANYLSDAWLQTDGEVLATQSFKPSEHDFTYPIKHILNLDESEQRYRKLRNLLGRNLEYTPRRRHDVDAIFINAHPTAARSLNPQLRFYHAADVPVYATPHLYSGAPNPSQDIDLNNITFCDIPWLFADAYEGEFSQEALRNAGQPLPPASLRLIALGIDAYNLVAHLEALSATQYQGATGNLLLNNENRVTRQLVCAKFIDGIPVVSSFIDPASEDYQSITVDNPPSSTDTYSPIDAH